MAWTVPEYTPQQVNAAGRGLVWAWNTPQASWTQDQEFAYWADLDIINNWRASHSYPLNTFQVNLRDASRKFDRDVLIAQRIKRMYSIGLKLTKHDSMRLTQMQDIGGCRAVLANVDATQALVRYFQKTSRMKHTLRKHDDYITEPKASGYRGVHLVYDYQSSRATAYNGLKIEMQLRSKYQHAWATAVETVGAFVRQALKSSMGDDDWLRFFALMGSAIAIREKSPLVPGTPERFYDVLSELEHYAAKLHVENRLSAYRDAVQTLSTDTGKKAHWFLMKLDPQAQKLHVTGYPMFALAEAEAEYAKAEREVHERPGTDAVLVSVPSLAQLKRAYPNYFADTRLFVRLMSSALSVKQRVTARKA